MEEAYANYYSFIWGKAVAKNKEKLEVKAEKALSDWNSRYTKNFASVSDAQRYF